MPTSSDAKQADDPQRQHGETNPVPDGRRRASLEKLAAVGASVAHHSEHQELHKGRLRLLADEIALRELELLNARFAEAKVLREMELGKKAEKAREVSGLDRFLERKAHRESLREEITRREEDLLNAKMHHADELRQEILRSKIASATGGLEKAATKYAGQESALSQPDKTTFDRVAELHRLREEHAEQIHKAALEERLRRAEAVDHVDRALQNKEIIDVANAEKARRVLEKLDSRTNEALERRRASMEDIAVKAHQTSSQSRYAETRAQLEERNAEHLAAQLREDEARLKAAGERRRASLDNVAATAHRSANLEKHAENRERLDAEFEDRVLRQLREEEERSAAAYERRRRALEEIAAKTHQAADLPRYAEIRSQLGSLAEERRKKREEELESRTSAALQRRRMSLENVTKFAHADNERVAQKVARYEEKQKHKLEMLIAEQKLMGLHARDADEVGNELAVRSTLFVPEEGVPVPQNTPVEPNSASGHVTQ